MAESPESYEALTAQEWSPEKMFLPLHHCVIILQEIMKTKKNKNILLSEERIMRELQMKTTLSVEKREPSYTVGGNAN